jgi:hypothetical protein
LSKKKSSKRAAPVIQVEDELDEEGPLVTELL